MIIFAFPSGEGGPLAVDEEVDKTRVPFSKTHVKPFPIIEHNKGDQTKDMFARSPFVCWFNSANYGVFTVLSAKTHLSLRQAIPGRDLPSRNSRDAPPPVET